MEQKNEYWLVIDALCECVMNGKSDECLKNALHSLSVALDRRKIYNLPSDETKRLVGALYAVLYNEQGEGI